MFTTISPARPAILNVGAGRPLAIAIAVTVAAGGTTLAFSGDDAAAPAQQAAPSSAPPIQFGDPAVVKGARGGATGPVRLQATAPLFGDPTVRKGAGGR